MGDLNNKDTILVGDFLKMLEKVQIIVPGLEEISNAAGAVAVADAEAAANTVASSGEGKGKGEGQGKGVIHTVDPVAINDAIGGKSRRKRKATSKKRTSRRQKKAKSIKKRSTRRKK